MIELKNKFATVLMNQRQIVIEGIEINLWHGHSTGSLASQYSWNKIASYTKLNSNTSGENGHLVFSGVMQIHRDEAADYAVKMGFKVHQQISPYTDYLIVGSENVSPSKIAKIIKINAAQERQIRIIDEMTFLSIVSDHIG